MVSELILAASGAGTAISEKFQTAPTNTVSMGTGVTIAVVGKIATADVADPGIVIVTGNTSTGQSVTLTVTPTANTWTGTLTWTCLDTPAKCMPATCR